MLMTLLAAVLERLAEERYLATRAITRLFVPTTYLYTTPLTFPHILSSPLPLLRPRPTASRATPSAATHRDAK